jgi:hypothetical protein
MMRKLTFVALMLMAITASAQQIDIKSLDKFGEKAKSKTEINLDESTVKSASDLLNQKNGDEAAARKSAKDLKGLFLRNYEFEMEGEYKREDLKPILDQLKAPNWTPILRNQEKNEQTEIWMHLTNGQADGMILVSMESKEVTVINAVGITNMGDLSNVGQLGNLAGQSSKPPAKPEDKKGNNN